MKYAKAYEIFASQMFWRILFHLRRNRRFHPSLLGFHIAKQYFILITSMHLNTFLHPLVHLVGFALAEHEGHIFGEFAKQMRGACPSIPTVSTRKNHFFGSGFFNEIRLSANTSLNLSLSLKFTTLLPLSPPDKFSHRILREVNFYVNILQKL